MKANTHHQRHPTLTDGLDIMAPPAVNLYESDGDHQHMITSTSATTHHHHRPESTSSVPILHHQQQYPSPNKHVLPPHATTSPATLTSPQENLRHQQQQQQQQRSLFGNYNHKRHTRHRDETIALEKTTLEFLASMEQDSIFFEKYPQRPIAMFEANEIQVNGVLGMGEFGVVMKVTGIVNQKNNNNNNKLKNQQNASHACDGENCHHQNGNNEEDDQPPMLKDETNTNTNKNDGTDTQARRSSIQKQWQSCNALASLDWLSESTRSSILVDTEDSQAKQEELRSKLYTTTSQTNKSATSADSNNTGKTDPKQTQQHHTTTTTSTTLSLAMKQLRKDLYPKKKLEAAKDLAREAKLLTTLSQHANIIPLRGIVSQPGRIDFGILIDQLPKTLDEQKTTWKAECLYSSQYIFPWQSQQRILDFRRILTERVRALRDVARAMNHLHQRMILFRDLKPENCAQSKDRVVQLFDFGLAKELKPIECISSTMTQHQQQHSMKSHHTNNDNHYSNALFKATGLTGTLRIMAPEVIQCRPYGLHADVYSYGIVMYEVFAGERCQLTAAEICKGQRPTVPPHIGHPFSDWLQSCWSPNPFDRPTMKQICHDMELEYNRLVVDDLSLLSSTLEQ